MEPLWQRRGWKGSDLEAEVTEEHSGSKMSEGWGMDVHRERLFDCVYD